VTTPEPKSTRPPSVADHRRDVGHFDRWAPRYERSWTQRAFFGPVHRGVAEALAPLAPAPRRVLDIGCGTGALLRLLAHRYPQAHLVGIDASKEMIGVASANNPFPERLHFLHSVAENLPVEDAAFDLVVSTISFHHWADQQRGLLEAARALAAEGRFLLADHFVTPLQRIFYPTAARRRRFHTPTEIDRMLDEAGFRDQQWHRIYAIGPLLIVSGVIARESRSASPLV
jgi:SAM-dependent methyltransferase